MTRLYDAYGQPLDRSRLRKEIAAPRSSAARFSARFSSVRSRRDFSVAGRLTPDRLSRLLREAAAGSADDYLTLAEEMEEMDLHYASVLGTRKRAVSGLTGLITPASDDKRDQEIAEACRPLLEDPAFESLLDELLDALAKGYTVCEMIWEGGKVWRPRAYLWRDPRLFFFDPERPDRLRLKSEHNSKGENKGENKGEELAAFHFIRHVPKLKCGLPIRGGLARLAAVAFLCKSYTIKDWMGFVEVYGMPLRLGRYGASATEEDKDTLLRAVANIGTDAAAIMPETMQVEFIEAAKASGKGDSLFQATADWWDRQVSKAVLGQTASTEGMAGKLGADDSQEQVRQDILKADAKQLAVTINRDLIRPFVELNFGVQARYPRFHLPVEDPDDQAVIIAAAEKLAPLGFRISQRDIRQKLRLKEPEEADDLLGLQSPSQPESLQSDSLQEQTSALHHSGRRAELNAQAVPKDEDEIDEAYAEELAAWEEQVAPMLTPVQEAINKAASYEEALSALAAVQEQMDSRAFIEALSQAAFKARALGENEGENGGDGAD